MEMTASVNQQLTQQLQVQQRQVQKLASRDREVRAHEQAHAAVGGAQTGSPSFQYTQGPNGVRYASSGSVNIDISAVAGDPQATLLKMQTVARAATAPAQPSGQDRAVAAQANAQAAQARAELVSQRQDELAQVTGSEVKRAMGSVAGGVIDVIV